MKTSIIAITLALRIISFDADAGPITKNHVPADAGWIAHLDLDRLQKSQLGATLIRSFIEPKALEASDTLSRSFGIDLDWHQIHSITAYGRQLGKHPENEAVLLVESDLPLQKTIEQLVGQLKGNPGAGKQLPLQRSQVDGFELFSINQDAYFSLPATNLLVLGKNQGSRHARAHASPRAGRPGCEGFPAR